ncbi:MAG: MATE family efflux transporter [Schwartzia sp. (in: firmicutes)]
MTKQKDIMDRACLGNRPFFSYTIPSIFAMWMFALYTMADGYFVANYVGEMAFSAVNLSLPVITSFFALGMLLSTGTQSKVGFYLGRGAVRAAREVFTTGICALFLCGIFYTAALGLFLDDVVRLLGAGAMIFSMVKEYLCILLPFGVFFMTTYQMETLAKVDGFPRFAALSVSLAGLINLGLDYLFIVHFSMGLWGAGLATGVAQVASTALLLAHFFWRRGKLYFVKTMQFFQLKRIVSIGVGDALAEMAIGYTVFLFNTTLLRLLGQNGVIVYTVISYLSVFVQVTMTGVAQGVAPLFSIEYGRREFARIYSLLWRTLAFVSLLGIGFTVGVSAFSVPLVDVFLAEGSRLHGAAADGLMKFSLSYLFMGYNIFLLSFFASLGRGRIAAVLSFFRTPVAITIVMLAYEKWCGGDGIWYVLAVAEGVTLIVGGILLKRFLRDELPMAVHG